MTKEEREAARKALAAYWAGSCGASVARSVASGEAKGYSDKERKAAKQVVEAYERGDV